MENRKGDILICLPNDQLGGAEQFLQMLAKEFQFRGYRIFVYFLTKRKYSGWDDLGESIILNYGNSTKERNGVPNLIQQLFNQRYRNFSFCFTSHTHLTGLIGLLRRSKMISIQQHVGRESTSIFHRFTGLKLKLFRLYYWIGYSSLDLLVCQTDFMKNQLIEGIPKISRKIRIVVMQNPIDIKNLIGRSNDFLNPKCSNMSFVVSAGRLIYLKGFDILIESFKKIASTYPKLQLVLLGDGEEEQKLNDLAKSLGIGDRVHLLGRVQNVYPYFRAAEVCVVSSRIEGFPNVLLQMMSQNTNVVSTECAGGIKSIPMLPTCSPNDIESLADLMDLSLQSTELERNNRLVSFNDFLNNNSLEKFTDRLLLYLRNEN